MQETLLSESITLGQAGSIIRSLAAEQSILLLSPPGVGKSDIVNQIAMEAGLECRSLLGTQIAPEDVSGIPRIVGERSVFCPPRVLLPENPDPFCLFLDELPATAPDVQKAFYSLLLERRIGENKLPPGTWVVAAGNRVEDRALVRAMSSALVNRVVILNIHVDVNEWFAWARKNGIRSEILSFINFIPETLMREVPSKPVPFSTPRSWTMLSRALDIAEKDGILTNEIFRALAFGRLSASDAAIFCAMIDKEIPEGKSVSEYINNPELLPEESTGKWFVLSRIRKEVSNDKLAGISPDNINKFLMSLSQEYRFSLFVDLVDKWGSLGADESMLESLREVTGL